MTTPRRARVFLPGEAVDPRPDDLVIIAFGEESEAVWWPDTDALDHPDPWLYDRSYYLPLAITQRHPDALDYFKDIIEWARVQWDTICRFEMRVDVRDVGVARFFRKPVDPTWHSIEFSWNNVPMPYMRVHYRMYGIDRGSLNSGRLYWNKPLAFFEREYRRLIEPRGMIQVDGYDDEALKSRVKSLDGWEQIVSIEGLPAVGGFIGPYKSIQRQARQIMQRLPRAGLTLSLPDRLLDREHPEKECWIVRAEYRWPFVAARMRSLLMALAPFALETAPHRVSVYVALFIVDWLPAFRAWPEHKKVRLLRLVDQSIQRVYERRQSTNKR